MACFEAERSVIAVDRVDVKNIFCHNNGFIGYKIRNKTVVFNKTNYGFRYLYYIIIYGRNASMYYKTTARNFSKGMPRFLSLLSLLRSIRWYTASIALRVLALSDCS